MLAFWQICTLFFLLIQSFTEKHNIQQSFALRENINWHFIACIPYIVIHIFLMKNIVDEKQIKQIVCTEVPDSSSC